MIFYIYQLLVQIFSENSQLIFQLYNYNILIYSDYYNFFSAIQSIKMFVNDIFQNELKILANLVLLKIKFLDMKIKLLSLAMLTSIENNKTQKIDLNNLNSGVYVVSVLNGANKVILNKKISLNK